MLVATSAFLRVLSFVRKFNNGERVISGREEVNCQT